MTVEERLLNYKKELIELKTKIDREIGSLDATYKRLAEKLEVKGKKIKVEKAAKEKIKKLNAYYEQFNRELNDLTEEIESNLEQYEDEQYEEDEDSYEYI